MSALRGERTRVLDCVPVPWRTRPASARCRSLPQMVCGPSLFARDPDVKRWIWFEILRPHVHPSVILYFSPSRFKTRYNEYLLTLPTDRYNALSAYTRERIARDDCPREDPPAYVWYITPSKYRSAKRVRHSAARYPSHGHVTFSQVCWHLNRTTTERENLGHFIAEERCSVPARAPSNEP